MTHTVETPPFARHADRAEDASINAAALPRILVFCYDDIAVGAGTPIRARLLAHGLHDLGATIGVVASRIPPEFASWGIVTRERGSGESHKEALSSFAKEFRPDIIYCITEGEGDTAAAVAQDLGCALAYDLHGIGIVEILELGTGFGSRLPRLRASARALFAMRHAGVLTVANPTLFPIVRAFHPNVVPAFGMVDVDHFSPRGAAEVLGPQDRLQVLYAGNFFPWQGCDLLLSAARLMLNAGDAVDFTFIGSMARVDEQLRPWSDVLASPHVRLHESVPYHDMPRFLRGADVLVIPRPWMLSTYLAFPNKLPDYLASGRAIVATDIASHRYAITDGVSGIIAAPNPPAIATALRRLGDASERASLGAAARQFAVSRLAASVTSQRVLDALGAAVRQHRKR